MDSIWIVSAVQSVATIVLAVLTYSYVKETRALRNQSKQALEDGRRERLSALLPFLVVRQTVYSPQENKRIFLANIGRGAAMKIEFRSEVLVGHNALPHIYDDNLRIVNCIQSRPLINGEALAPGNGSIETGILLHTVGHDNDLIPLNAALARALIFYEDSIGRGFVTMLFNGEYIQGLLYDSSLSWDKKRQSREEFMKDMNLSSLKEKAEALRVSTSKTFWDSEKI